MEYLCLVLYYIQLSFIKMVGVLDSQQNRFKPAPICCIFKCYDEITGSPLLAVIEIIRFLDIISKKERE